MLVNKGFISDESHAFAPFRAKLNLKFYVTLIYLAYLIDSSKVIKVSGKQKPYEMRQAGISLAASPLTKCSRASPAREYGSRIPPVTQAKRSVHSICIEQIDPCLPTVEGDFVVTERSLSQRF